MNESRWWTPERVEELMEMVADGFAFDACAMALGCSEYACEREFEKQRQRMGPQAK